MLAKIQTIVKEHANRVVLAIIVLLLVLASFAAGYLAARNQLKTPIQIETYGSGTNK